MVLYFCLELEVVEAKCKDLENRLKEKQEGEASRIISQIGLFAVVCTENNAARFNVSHYAFFSSRSKKNSLTFILWQENKSNVV